MTQEPKAWDPNDLMAILDGFESIRWAWILFDMGNEADVNEYIEWFIRMCKDRKDRLFQVKALWLAASWRLATDMRQGSTFNAATQTLRSDTEWVQDRLGQARKGPAKGKSKGDDSRRQTSRGRGTSKGKGKGRGNSQQSTNTRNNNGPADTNNRLCDGFNRGSCRFGDNCRDIHKCKKCGGSSHGARECRSQGKGGKSGKAGKDRSRSDYRSGKGDNRGNGWDRNGGGGSSGQPAAPP